MTSAREYFAKVVSWPQTPDDGFIGLHWTVPGRSGGKPYWTGRAVRSVDEAVRTLEWARGLPDTRDVYLCLSRQQHAQEKTSKSGHKYFSPMRSQSAALGLKSLFMDLDVKPGTGYADQNEAVRGLATFLKETGLPKPSVVVLSGGGLHVYFTLAHSLPPDEWKVLAYALAEAGKQHGLKFDAGCTIDSARVLRVPDTSNFKTTPPRPVSLAFTPLDFDYSVERIEQLLEPYKTQVPAQAQSLTLPAGFAAPSASVLAKFQVANDLSAGLEREYPKPNLDEVAPECSFLDDALSTGGKDYPQPMWNLTTLLATFTEGGRADAHRMSNQHPGYTKESTDEFFDRKDRERTEKGLGWPSCASISSTGCTACQSCKHFTKGRTPFHTVLQVAAAIGVGALGVGAATPGPATAAVHPSIAGIAPNDLPANYYREADGIVKVVIRDKDDPSRQEYVPIAAYSMEEPWLQLNPDILNFTSRIEQGKPKPVHIELACVGTAEMRKILQGQGFMLPHGDRATTRIAEFMNSWIKNLRDTRASVQSAPFGWNDRGSTIDGFVYGGNVWRPTGSTAAAASEPELRRQYDPIGELEPWVKATKMITDQQRPALEVIIASSFGAPLVMFTGEPGVILSAFSKESGIGKSTAMKVALAVWGDPYSAMLSLDDTKNYAMGKLGRLRHLPMFWDEIKSEAQTRKLVDITFEVTGAKEKGRMSRDASLREPGQWRTLFVAASNESLLDPVMKHTPTTTAGLYRVFEFVVPPGTIGQIVPSDAALMVADLARNHGAVGLAYAKFLGENQVAIADQMKLLLEQLYAETNSKGEERFWVVAIASVILGARYANHLGVATLDEVGIKKFLLSSLSQMRTHMTEQPVDLTKEVNLSNIMAGYLSAARQKHILFTNKLHVGRGKPTAGSIIVESSMCDSSKMDGVWVHYGMTDGLVRFAHAPLKHWLSEMGYAPSIVTTGMMQEYKAHRTQGNIGAGTKFKGGTEYLYELDLINAPNLDIR